MSEMNVLLVVPWDQESGGVAAVVGYLARHLESQGHRVLFLHPGASEIARLKTTKWGFRGVELNLRTPFIPERPLRSVIAFLITLPFTLFQLVRVLRTHDIRLVNVHFPGPAFVYFALCRWLLPLRLVISIHGTDVLQWQESPSRALELLFRTADLIVAPSWGFLRRCGDALAAFPARRMAIHNGTDLSDLAGQEGRDGSDPFVLSVSSLDEWKGLDVLIRAVALLRDSGTTIRVVIAGEGPLRGELERLASSLGLDEQVQMIGQQTRAAVARLLRDCTMFVLASRFETFGIAVVEALACGKAVVGTKVDGIPEIIEDGTSGILVQPDDPAALAGAIRRLLDDDDLRSRLGEAGRLRVEDRFQWQHMGANYVNVFSEVLA
jgi:glycosyltransferase involved in cell wall biosynthesis